MIADEGNQLTVAGGEVLIDARPESVACLKKELEKDLLRALAQVRVDSARAHPNGLELRWDERNWCRIAVVKEERPGVGVWWGQKGGGGFYAAEMVDGELTWFRLGDTLWTRHHWIGIELAEDGIRYLSSPDGEFASVLAARSRPEEWKGKPPAELIVGKNRADAPAFAGEEREAATGNIERSSIGAVRISELPAERRSLTPLEQRIIAEPLKDWIGIEERSGGREPSFESVAQYYPAMLMPRELIGVKEHPDDLGVGHDGSIQLRGVLSSDAMDTGTPVLYWEAGEPGRRLGFKVGSAKKRLLDGWKPIVITNYGTIDGVEFEQVAFGHSERWSATETLMAYSRLQVRNTGSIPRNVRIACRVQETTATTGGWSWQWTLWPGEERKFGVSVTGVPQWGWAEDLRDVHDIEFDWELAEQSERWEELLSRGMRINVPEKRVNDAYRAWLAYNFMNVDREDDGNFRTPDGAGFYENLYGYSAAHQIIAYDQYGFHDEARAYLASNMRLVNEDGLWVTRFGLPDNGALMAAIYNHYWLTGDKAWLETVMPKMKRMVEWVAARRAEGREAAPEIAKGLIFFRPYADYPEPTYSYFTDAYLCASMVKATRLCQELGDTAGAEQIAREAAAYRADILKSMDAAVFERDGMTFMPMFPVTHDTLKTAQYRSNSYHGLVSCMILDVGFLEPDGPQARQILLTLENNGGITLGVLAFMQGIDHAYSYGYLFNALERDAIDKVLLGFYSFLAYGMSRETYSGAEMTDHRSGDNHGCLPHGFSNTEQLRLLRNMLVREEGDRLRLAQATPRPWLAEGAIEVTGAPTRFGDVDYRIEPRAGGGRIDATVRGAWRVAPGGIALRRRPPGGKRPVSVDVAGGELVRIAGEDVIFRAGAGEVRIVARYQGD